MVKDVTYIPILKWKGAEKDALVHTALHRKKYILPVLEFVRPTLSQKQKEKLSLNSDTLINEHIDGQIADKLPQKISSDIFKCWGDGFPFIGDTSLLGSLALRKDFTEKFVKHSSLLGLKFIPLLNCSDSWGDMKMLLSNLSKSENGFVCLRINTADIQNPEIIERQLNNLMSIYSKRKTLILVDLKEKTSDQDYAMVVELYKQHRQIFDDYLSIIVAGGAFPQDMSPFSSEEMENYWPRKDLTNWKEYIDKEIPNSIFGDYTIRHPIYKEALMFHRPTASIKYTLDSKWRIYKGRRNNMQEYLGHAVSLAVDNNTFYGVGFSDGDSYIHRKSEYYQELLRTGTIKSVGKVKTGNTKTWLYAGINHHIAVTVDQLSPYAGH